MQNQLLNFILGGLFSLAVLAFGVVLGYYYGAKEEKLLERKASIKAKRIMRRNKGESSGSVRAKVVTNADAEAMERAPFVDRFKQLGAQEPGDEPPVFLEP